MGSPFADVYDFFMIKISDFDYANYTQAELEDELLGYLKVAITKFKRCKIDLTISDFLSGQFDNILPDDEKEILSVLMVIEYLKPKLLTGKILKQTLSNKDYRLYSQANHLKELQALYAEMKKEADHLITEYTYNHGNLDDLK